MQSLSDEQSARRTWTWPQALAAILTLTVVLVWLCCDWRSCLAVLNSGGILAYVAICSHKIFLTVRALMRVDATGGRAQEVNRAAANEDLPDYTILVPLYREAEVVADLVEHLHMLDYPPEKLQILLLVEEDDAETKDALNALSLLRHFQVVSITYSYPRTKSKACNEGLKQATGELLVIYDAEDRPERDQLRKAAGMFREAGVELSCVQARLNYYNPRQNLLTRLFAAEYSFWFDLMLPGLSASDAPIPLGGTSNHFRTDVLRKVGGWDAYNVTEDCDLGLRLAEAGYTVTLLDSTTWEEANSRLSGWLKQRSRWVKGYLQTYLVHTRHPVTLWRSLGLRKFLHFHLVIGGSLFSFFVNPLYWLVGLLWCVTRSSLIASLFVPGIYHLGLACFFLGNFAFLYLNMLACLERKFPDLVKHQFLLPGYWVLMSLAAYQGAAELLSRPHYWQKTEHGFHRDAPGHLSRSPNPQS